MKAKILIVALLSLLPFACVPAYADLAHGTPLFTCTYPTQGLDSFGALYTLPATGVDALKEVRWYLDPTLDANGFVTSASKFTVSASQACAWQTTLADISAGAHTVRATAVDNSLRESKASSPLAFTVPAATRTGPVAPAVQPPQ